MKEKDDFYLDFNKMGISDLKDNNFSLFLDNNDAIETTAFQTDSKNSGVSISETDKNNDFRLFSDNFEENFENQLIREKSSDLSVFEFNNEKFNINQKREMELMQIYLENGKLDLNILNQFDFNKENHDIYKDLSVSLTRSIGAASQYSQFLNNDFSQNDNRSIISKNNNNFNERYIQQQNYLDFRQDQVLKKVDKPMWSEQLNSNFNDNYKISKLNNHHENFKFVSKDEKPEKKINYDYNKQINQSLFHDLRINPSPLINFKQKVLNPFDLKTFKASEKHICKLCLIEFELCSIIVTLECSDHFHRDCLLEVLPEKCFCCGFKIVYS